MKQIDSILEGVRPLEIKQLQAIASGDYSASGQLGSLEAKGWVETVAGTPLITLTGRTLLDGATRV